MNLLPQYQKDAIRKDILVRFFFVVEGVIFFWALIFLVLPYNVVLYLNIQTAALEERFAAESLNEISQALSSAETEINELNEVLSQIQKIRNRNTVNLPDTLRKVGEFVPAGISFRNLSFRGRLMTITGDADTREHALLLKEDLEKDSICANLSSSPAIFKEKNIAFTFTCTLK